MSATPFDPDLTTAPRASVYCLGCKRRYRYADYHDHDCENPQSGEAFK